MANWFTRIVGGVGEARSATPTLVAPARSATTVSPETAMTLASVYRAVQVIAIPVSKMEIKTHRWAGGMTQRIDNPIFVNKPSLSMSRREFLYANVADLALYGNAYWLKNLDGKGQVNNVELLAAKYVIPWVDRSTGKAYYTYFGETYDASQIQHLRLYPRAYELKGESPIDRCADDIGAALDLRDYQATWFKNGGVPTGILKTTNQITKEDAERISADWAAKQATRQTAVLGNSFSYDAVSLSPKDALFTEVHSQSVQNIARMFGVPPRLLLTGVDASSDTYTNLQDENQVFYRHTLTGYCDTLADAFSDCLPRGTSVEFDFEALFRADIASRYNYYKIGVEGGWLQPEEIRAKEGLDG